MSKKKKVICAVVNGSGSNDLTVVCGVKHAGVRDCGPVQLRKFEVDVDYRLYVHGTVEVNAKDQEEAISALNEILDNGSFVKDLRKHEVREFTHRDKRVVFRSWDKVARKQLS